MSEPQKHPAVVITGASGDLGGALVDAWLADGWRVYGADLRPPEAREGLIPVELDVCDRAAVFALAERAETEGALKVWVNCAGVVAPGRIREADPAIWDRIIAVNLTGTFHGCAAALGAMIAAGQGGRIVNIGSISGQIGGLGMHPAYGASKAGVHTLTKSYAQEGARYGVACNAVAPSVIEGSMADGLTDDQKARLVGAHPMRRFARMEEVVHGVRYLADAQAASYVSGVILPINGGSYV